MVSGVKLHANVAVPARDRKRLERRCRYVARPTVSTARLAAQPDGRLRYTLKRRWRDGTTHVVFEPGELLERLVALIPPPRARRLSWSPLMQRVFAHGVLDCPSFRGHVRVIAAIEQPEIAAWGARFCTSEGSYRTPLTGTSGLESPLYFLSSRSA